MRKTLSLTYFLLTSNLSLITFYLLVAANAALAQGLLDPPGPPAPTMKSLDEIDTHVSQAGEKRIDVATLSGDVGNQYIISASGSYYLSGNITGVPGINGISIQADTGCQASNNTGDGILARNYCLVIANTCNNNHVNGIECGGVNNRIDSNHCLKNTNYGLKTIDDPNGGFIIHNSCLLNTGV